MKRISQQYKYPFQISKPGLVAVFVSARCKSKKQVDGNRDEDLRAEINGLQFREIPPEKNIQLFNIPASWNGSRLKGLKKTIVFLTILDKGEHILSFVPRNNALIEDIKVEELAGRQDLNFNLEEQAEDGDRRPWYTFVLVNLPLDAVTAKVTTKYRWRDSDDVKLIIDGKIQINKLSLFHRYWFWAGSLVKRLLGKETKEHIFRVDSDQDGMHYIEFWTDKMPVLHKVGLNLGKISFYSQAKVVWQEVNLREGPNTQSRSLAILRKDEKVEILERAVESERPKNQEGRFLFSDRWHRVKYKAQEGYIYSEALEIKGEDRKTIQNFIIRESEELREDKNLMLAIARQESGFHPYKVSQVEDPHRKGKGVMQITDQTRDEMRRHKEINYDLTDPFDFRQNIEGGIKYFKFIRSLYRRNKPDYLEKLLTGWNAGPFYIPEDKRDEPLDYDNLPNQTKNFINNVKKFYNEYRNKDQQGFIKKFWLAVLGAGIFLIGGTILFYQLFTTTENETKDFSRGKIVMIQENKDNLERVYKLIDDLDDDKQNEEINFRSHYNEEGARRTDVKFKKQIIKIKGGAPSGFTKDIDNDGKKEIIIELGVGVNGIWTEVYTFKDGQLNNVPVVDENSHSFSGFLGSGIGFTDYDNDGDLELESFWRVYDMCDPRSDIYEYIDGSLVFKKAVIYTEEERNACKKAREEFKG